MISTFVASLLILQAQDTPRDVKLPVMPMWQLGEWLGEQTGRDVIVLPQVQDKLIYINVKKRTLSELYGLIQRATGVEVLDKNGVLTLREDAGLQRVGELTAAGLQESIDRLNVKPLTEQEIRDVMPKYERIQKLRETQGIRSTDPDWKEFQAIMAMDPMKTGMAQFLKGAGGQTLANLPLYENVVFSTAPTRMQRAWPGNAKRMMSDLTDAMDVRNRVVNSFKKDDDRNAMMMYDSVRMSQFGEVAGGKDQPVAALTAKVQRMPYGITVVLTSFDKDGVGIVSLQDQVMDATMSRLQSEGSTLKEKLASLDQKYELNDAEFHEAQKLIAFFGGSNLSGSITREDIEWLATADQHEPLGGIASRLFDFAVEEAGSEIVTEVIMPFRFEPNAKSVTAGELMETLCGQSMIEASEPVIGGLIIGKPAPDWLRQFLVSRRSIAEIARRVLDQGKLTFDDLADGVAKLSSRDQMMLFVPAALHLSGQSDGQSYMQPRDWKEFLLIAYSQLTPAQRKAVFTKEGLEIDISRANAEIQKAFWTSTMCGNTRIPTQYHEVGGKLEQVAMVGDVPVNDWNRQATVFLTYPNAAPVRVRLTASDVRGLMVSQAHKQPDGRVYESTSFQMIQSYASTQAWTEVNPPAGNYVPPTVTGLAVSQQITVRMTVNFGDFSIDPTEFTMLGQPVGKLGPESELPQDVRDEIEKTKTQIREEYRKFQKGNQPPPMLSN